MMPWNDLQHDSRIIIRHFEALRISSRMLTFKLTIKKIVILKNWNKLYFHFEIFAVIKIDDEEEDIGYRLP